MLFDLGVYLVVVGATLVILLRLGRLHDTKPATPGGRKQEEDD